jgi:hypothetical protein
MTAQRGDSLALGRDVIARGFRASMLIVAHGARGPIMAIEQGSPASDSLALLRSPRARALRQAPRTGA